MLLSTHLAVVLQASAVLGCALHDNYASHPHLGKRQTVSDTGRPETDWAYEASYNWGKINPAYELCQTGTQQSPIALSLEQGSSDSHSLSFDGYNGSWTGNFYNWGYGPAFTLNHPVGDYTTLPPFRFDDETVYLTGWHVHAPADHSVGGNRSRAELHYVHVNAAGLERAVVAMLIDPSTETSSPFFASLPAYIHFNSTIQIEGVSLNLRSAVDEADNFRQRWSYQGGLTNPPCTEGLQWFVAQSIVRVSDDQLRDILRVSTYSAREEQPIWRHGVNE